MDARSEGRRRVAELFELGQDIWVELLDGIWPPVGQRLLGMIPSPLIRVEFGRVAWKIFQVQSRVPGLEFTEGRPLVDFSAVPQNDYVVTQRVQHLTQKRADLRLADVALVEPKVEADAESSRTHGQAGNGRDLAMRASVARDRGLPARGPSAAHRADQLEARLVNEDEVGAPVRRPFFMRGHGRCFQAVMRASWRSRARR